MDSGSSRTASVEPVGEITRSAKTQCEVEWRIPDFVSLMEKEEVYVSPTFVFAERTLRMFINVLVNDLCLGLYSTCTLPIGLEVSVGFKTFNGKKDQEKRAVLVENMKYKIYQRVGGLQKTELLERKLDFLPSNALTVLYTLKLQEATERTATTEIAECSHCKESFDANSVLSHEQKCLDKPIRCPKCTDVVALREWFNHECETLKVKASEKLINNLRSIFGVEEYSDVTVKVKDGEFRLHKCILAGRNPYFNSMFKTEMKEKATGTVIIDDCEPDVFRSFIHFLYTGKVDVLSLENVCDLYKVADKYQEDQLREECLCFMKTKISVENFCDFTVLALEYEEKELLQRATELFCRKTKEINQSVKWQTFMREYPTEANELHIKALDYNAK